MSIIKPFAPLRLLVAMLLGASCVTVAAQTAVPTPDIYTCIDAKGRKLTSDRKIPECSDREQKILNPSGTVKARIGPNLTAQERSEIETTAKTVQQERARLEEEKKRDRALLVRYPNEALHQKERAESLRQVMLVRQAAVARVTELLAERSKIDDEMAFYAKDPSKAPLKLRQQSEAVMQALAAQGRFLADKDNEMARTNARFDEELLRLKPLWRMNEAPELNNKTPRR
jgi:hypothetical protein